MKRDRSVDGDFEVLSIRENSFEEINTVRLNFRQEHFNIPLYIKYHHQKKKGTQFQINKQANKQIINKNFVSFRACMII